MINDIENKRINTIVTKDLSRLGRDYIETGRLIEKYFPENNIRYISILDNIDTYIEDINNDMVPFKSLLNDMYAKDISKKVRISLGIKKRQGLFLGWKAPYGYKKSSKNKYKLIIDKKTYNVIKKIFELKRNNKSSRDIAEYLTKSKIDSPSTYAKLNNKTNKWCPRTIDAILTNPTYIGNITQGIRRKISYKSQKEIRITKEKWIIIKNTHEPIISNRCFNEVQELINNKRSRESNIKSRYLLDKYLYCKECRYAISIVKSHDKKRSYTSCSYYRKHSKEKLCTPHSMRYEIVEDIVLQKINQDNKNKSNIKRILIDKFKKIDIEYL